MRVEVDIPDEELVVNVGESSFTLEPEAVLREALSEFIHLRINPYKYVEEKYPQLTGEEKMLKALNVSSNTVLAGHMRSWIKLMVER